MEGQKSLGDILYQKMETDGDVLFLVGPEGEEEEIKSVVFILKAVSSVFDVQFNENWKSQQNQIRLPDIHPKIFRLFLKLLLTDNINESHLSPDESESEFSMEDVIHLLYIGNKYAVSSIQSICRSFIKSRLAIPNAVSSFEALQNMNEPELEQTAFNFIILNIVKLLEESSFANLSRPRLAAVLKWEKLSVRELSLFKGVVRWAESECSKLSMEKSGEDIRKILGDLLFLIRFPLMSIQELYKSVRPLGILTAEEIVSISNHMVQNGDPSFSEMMPFNSKRRPNVTSQPLVIPKTRYFEHCFMYTPTAQVTLNHIIVPPPSSTSYSSNRYVLKLCISDGELDILPMITETESSPPNFSFLLDSDVTLNPGKTYFIYYDVKRNGVSISIKNISENSIKF